MKNRKTSGSIVLHLFRINPTTAEWNEYYDDVEDAIRRINKLHFSNNIGVFDITCDNQEDWCYIQEVCMY